MKRKRYTFIFVFAAMLGFNYTNSIFAQRSPNQKHADTSQYPYYIEMMQDPNADFFETKRAFEKYWEDHDDYKGNGWKIFKRWEYINEPRVQPDGKLPQPDHVMRQYELYKRNHLTETTSGNWTEIGPVNYPANATWQPTGMGRINGMAFHPADSLTFWAGSPSGGLWKTSNGGTSWSTLTEDMPTLGVSSILIHPSDPDIIWIGTGDRDGGDAPGMGVYLSTDGGQTWNASNTGMGNRTVGMMIMHPADPDIILAATSGGIYKTTDGGSGWTLKSSYGNYKDIKFNPGNPDIVYATAYGNFYRSDDNGESWTQITSGILSGSRIVIGVSPAQPSTVYVLQTSGPFKGLLKSTDNGLNFATQSTTPNIMDYNCDGGGGSSQAWYDLCIAVDTADADIIYAGGINMWKSTDAGVTWSIISHWVGSDWGYTCAPSVHADIHSLDWNPLTNDLYSGGDGGVYYSTDGGSSWTQISSTLAIAQIYKIGQSATIDSLVINGYQDNGTATNLGDDFTTVIGGDGMECIIDYDDPDYRYGSLYYGDIRRSIQGYSGSYYYQISNPITESGGWVTPYILHESTPTTMFAGFDNVWRSTNVRSTPSSAVTWTKISSGETVDCDVLEQSSANNDILYVVRNAEIQRSDNANAASPSWNTCTGLGSYVTDLEAHPTNENIVYATIYGGVHKSTDKGSSWSDISGTLPWVGINCIVYDTASSEGLYVGTQFGVFYKNDTMSDWVQFDDLLPAVDVRELEIYYDTDHTQSKIKAATYGRGLWESELYYSPSTPGNTNIQNITLNNGDSECYDATQTITVAGGGTTFYMMDGSSANMIAGNKISFMPGTHVYSGAELHAYIAPGGPFCNSSPIVSNPEYSTKADLIDEEKIASPNAPLKEVLFEFYPNPTKGLLNIIFNDEVYENGALVVELYSFNGELLMDQKLTGRNKYKVSMVDLPAGIYYLCVFNNKFRQTQKVIKN